MLFVDTNVLLYSVSDLSQEQRKTGTALSLLRRKDLAVSVQVLQEFYYQATRPGRPNPLEHEQAALLVEAYSRYPVQDLTQSILRSAMATCARWQISYWDAAILEAARALGCRTVLSEDLSHGQDYGGVRVENPFLDAA